MHKKIRKTIAKRYLVLYILLFGILSLLLYVPSIINNNFIKKTEASNVLPSKANASNFITGVTFTQYALDSWGDLDSIVQGRALLYESTDIVNQHIMGFGASNPEISPGAYDFSSIDKRVGVNIGTAKDANIISLTACCAPDWMKGGVPGTTDWGLLEVAPYPEYYDDYAALVAEIVSQPEFTNVEYLHVWNEFKGFWDSENNKWDYEGYTDLYNQIWDAVKVIRPDIKIGGPYIVIQSNGGGKSYDADYGGSWGKFDQRDLDAIMYWLQNKNGADFFAVDGKNHNKDRVELVDQFERTTKFADFMTWLRSLDNNTYPGATTLPVWWSEWYARTDDDSLSSAEEKNATMAAGLIRTIKSGAEAALIWQAQGDVDGNAHPLALFSDTRTAGGGQATLFQTTQKYIKDHFSAGTALYDAPSSNTIVETLASSSKLLIVNMSNFVQNSTILGQNIILQPYEVKLVDITYLTADVNLDGSVDIVDLSVLLSNWGTNNTGSDVNNDKIVDIVDLSIMLSQWTG